MHKFDFDEWADLYQRDPAAFEARRKAVLALAGPGGKARVPGAGSAAEPFVDSGAAERSRWLGRLSWIALA